MDLAAPCYRVTDRFPVQERFGLTSQIRRAVISVPANIAEGAGREHLNEYLRFLCIARGSLRELETHLLLASRLAFIDEAGCGALLTDSDHVGRLLSGLIRSLKRSRRAPPA